MVNHSYNLFKLCFLVVTCARGDYVLYISHFSFVALALMERKYRIDLLGALETGSQMFTFLPQTNR